MRCGGGLAVISASLTLVAALLAGCGSAGGNLQSPGHLVTYTNTTYGFSIQHPEGWSVETNPASQMAAHPNLDFEIFWHKPVSGSEAPGGMAVAVEHWRNRLSTSDRKELLPELLKLFRKHIGLQYPGSTDGSRIVRVRAVRVGTMSAVLVDARNPTTPTVISEDYYFMHRGAGYLLAFQGSQRDFATSFRGLPQTFELK
jgi:hypothetical protein